MSKGADLKDKIRKLLALAKSPEEHEAKAALLKARQLMAEHKLTEEELRDAEKQQVKDIRTDITCSKRKNPWIINLSAVIGENYCCKGYRVHGKGQQTQGIGFIGLEDDVELCVEIFKYAVDCVLAEIKRIKEECCDLDLPPMFTKRRCDSFGYGFVYGCSEAFSKQEEEHKEEWGLVLVMPQEVEEAAQHLGHQPFAASAEEDLSASAFFAGKKRGQEFDPHRRLAEEA